MTLSSDITCQVKFTGKVGKVPSSGLENILRYALSSNSAEMGQAQCRRLIQ